MDSDLNFHPKSFKLHKYSYIFFSPEAKDQFDKIEKGKSFLVGMRLTTQHFAKWHEKKKWKENQCSLKQCYSVCSGLGASLPFTVVLQQD